KIYDIDVFDTPSTTISALNNAGLIVICYMSVGSYEDWRPDVRQFPKSVRSKPLYKIWKGEWWLDVRQIATLGPIMKARMVLAVQKGFDGVEGDNVDGYTNDSGFLLNADDQVAYNRWLADTAHSLGLLVGLKNTMTLASQLFAWYDFALLEQCVYCTSCDSAKPFLNANLAVF
ncbi:glycoside hydrolase family 114 protein, partial [Gonapodya prolifera JEL478]